MTVQEAIRYLIEQKILSEQQISKVTGYSQGMVNRWRNGEYVPPYDVGEKLVKLASKAAKRQLGINRLLEGK